MRVIRATGDESLGLLYFIVLRPSGEEHVARITTHISRRK